jgi:hypothetical protein
MNGKKDELNVELYLAGRFIKRENKNKTNLWSKKYHYSESRFINTKITINQDALSSFGASKCTRAKTIF